MILSWLLRFNIPFGSFISCRIISDIISCWSMTLFLCPKHQYHSTRMLHLRWYLRCCSLYSNSAEEQIYCAIKTYRVSIGYRPRDQLSCSPQSLDKKRLEQLRYFSVHVWLWEDAGVCLRSIYRSPCDWALFACDFECHLEQVRGNVSGLRD